MDTEFSLSLDVADGFELRFSGLNLDKIASSGMIWLVSSVFSLLLISPINYLISYNCSIKYEHILVSSM